MRGNVEDKPEPFVLYMSGRFAARAVKAFGLGVIVRKIMVEMLKRMGVQFKELGRDEAKAILDRLAESTGITVTTGQLIKSVALSLFGPTPIVAMSKRMLYRSGAETEDAVLLEFEAQIPRVLRPTLFYLIWLVVPKSEIGRANTVKLIKAIVEKTGAPPLTRDEWEGVKPIIEKFTGKLGIKGATENLWETLLRQSG